MKDFRILVSSLICLVTLGPGAVAQDTLAVSRFRHAGPVDVHAPFMIDTVNIAGKAFDIKQMLDAKLSFAALEGAAVCEGLPQDTGKGTASLHLAAFKTQNSGYAKADLCIEGLEDYKLYVDGQEKPGKGLSLDPGTHEFVIKYLVTKTDAKPVVRLVRSKGAELSLREDDRRIYDLDLNTIGKSCGGVRLSPSGRYLTITHVQTAPDGKRQYVTDLLQLPAAPAKGRKVQPQEPRVLFSSKDRLSWMPASDRLWYTRKVLGKVELVALDPATGTEQLLAVDIPEESFTIAPTEDCLIFYQTQEGPKEGAVHQILSPEDRQPGWRDRRYISRYELATGVLQPLTYGYHNAWVSDISADGSKMLFSSSRENYGKRPSSLSSYYIMDLATMEVSCILDGDGFLGSAHFSPDAGKVLFQGSPEAFGGIGKRVKEGQIPNGYDYQLYVMDIASREVKPLTADFAPSVSQASWSKVDGFVYATVEEADHHALYRIDPVTARAQKIDLKEEYVSSFDMAEDAALAVYYGQSLTNYQRAYVLDLRDGSHRLIRDYNAERMAGVDFGEGGAYEFTSSRGDLINGFYVLPPDFDPAKKYPMIVHYYGGCSPSQRYCTGSYSPQVYAAQGYIFYVINPSGAAGFGQEFAARHVNTAGDVVADDIIEGVQNFVKDHPYVDADHIGCFSASYGGFMTQLLLCKTDMFATGISHAGISDHSSYWGEGYWGYSYSEVSMADSYPWTRKDLYVDRSPLYMADRIHTPLLFVHGSADTNVPIGESIQMYTALTLLGQDTAFVVVDGENHHIIDFSKNRQWLRTMFAWFAKYLKEDSTWWEALYPEKNF